MADIRRDVGDVSPQLYVRQGVQDTSAATIFSGLAQGAMQLDTELAQDRLQNELEGLRTTYEVSSPAAIAVQEGAPALSPEDQKDISRLERELKVGQAARDQGRLTFDSYRVRGERALRVAISKRPGLAQEFRAIAAQTLGVDVVGASVDVLAAGERSLMQQAEGAAKETAEAIDRMRKDLDTYAGVVTGGMSDAQIIEQYQANLEGMTQAKRAKVASEVGKNLAATQEAGQALRTPQATSGFIDQANVAKADLYRQVGQVKFALESPTESREDKQQILVGSRATVHQRISELNKLAAEGDVDPAIAAREIESLTTLGTMFDQLALGGTGVEIDDAAVKGITAYASHVLMASSDEVPYLSASVKAFGPEIMSQYYGPTGQFNKVVPLAIGKAMSGTGNPVVTAASAADAVSSTMKTVFDKTDIDPEAVNQAAELYGKLAESFVVVPDSGFKQSQFNGPSGFAGKLYLHREALAKQLGPEQRAKVATTLAAATYNSQRVLSAALFQKYPSLRDKVVTEFDPGTGKLYWPRDGASLTPMEQAAVAQWNQEFGGDRLITTIATIGGYGKDEAARQKAVTLVYNYGGYVEEARKAVNGAQEARAGGRSTQGSSPSPRTPQTRNQGPSQRWWE
jgi:hypothetical protein